MHFQNSMSALALIASISLTVQGHPLEPRSSALTANQILAVAPKSASCNGAPKPAQCRTAQQALPHIACSFRQYGVTSAGEQAALLSTMVFESDSFKYNVNVFPGTPGQGTRNMQSTAFNLKYAKSIPALSQKLAAIKTTDPNAVRDLLTADDHLDFGSAAWFLKTQCGPEISQGLAAGSLAGWKAYITGCLGTTVTDSRQAVYKSALAALGVAPK